MDRYENLRRAALTESTLSCEFPSCSAAQRALSHFLPHRARRDGAVEAQRRRAGYHPRPAIEPARAAPGRVLQQRQQRAAGASDAGVAAAAED
eukprot:scaffold114515_cov63-Phaeocystis_antarctica.AAC.3